MIWFYLTDKSSSLYPDTFLLVSTVDTVELIKPDKNLNEANVEKHRGGALYSVAFNRSTSLCLQEPSLVSFYPPFQSIIS
jgi:hypothetical protein